MSTTRRKAGKQSPPPSAAAIERRAWDLRVLQSHGTGELAAMCLDRLQRAVVTPQMIENEIGEAQDVLKACLTLRQNETTQAAKLHRRLSSVIARELWERGEVDAARSRVLNALRAFLEYMRPDFRPGWDSWTTEGAK